MNRTIPQFTLAGQIVVWLRSLPKYADIETYVGKFPDDQLQAFYDSIEFGRVTLMNDKAEWITKNSMQSWESMYSELEQYEQLQTLIGVNIAEIDVLLSLFPSLKFTKEDEFQGWCKSYLNNWFVLSTFASTREYLTERTYLNSLYASITDLNEIISLQSAIETILTTNAIQASSQIISNEQLEIERSVLTKLEIFSKQSIVDFMEREVSRYELFEKLFNVLTIIANSNELALEDLRESLRRKLTTRSLRYLLGRCERERIRRLTPFNSAILPWVRDAWTGEKLKNGKTMEIMKSYLESLSTIQGAELFPYIRAFISNSSVLEDIFEPVPALEVCSEIKQVMENDQKFAEFSDIVVASRAEYKDECAAALQVLRILTQRFPMF